MIFRETMETTIYVDILELGGFYYDCFGIGGFELIVHHSPQSPIYMYPFNLFNLFGMICGVVSIY